MAISQDTQDAITAAVTAATTAVLDAQTEALKAANGRGNIVPPQFVEGQLTDDAGNLIWQLDAQGNQVLDSSNKPIPVMGLISTVTGKPRKSALDIYQAQRGPEPEQPDWNWNPSAGADAIPVKTPQQIAEEAQKKADAEARRIAADAEFKANIEKYWLNNNPPPSMTSAPAPRPTASKPVDPYSTNGITLEKDPVSNADVFVSPRDPWTGKWTVSGPSGLSAASSDSAAAAAAAWNTIVAAWKAKP
ncbi:hypothetical protein IIK97_004079 [Salmonella enterica subsp. enterica serovar Nigeria]|nr:hypothetical protein [Salmonella enterica subsp. enterica serovar Nigeria]